MEDFWNRGTPSHHPFIDRFSIVNHPALGLPPWLWNPPYIYIFTWVCQKSQWLLHQSFDLPDLTLVWNRQKTRYMGSTYHWDMGNSTWFANHRYHRHGNWYLGTPIDLETLTSRRRNTEKNIHFNGPKEFKPHGNFPKEFKPQKASISMARVSPRPFGGLHLWSPPGFPKRPQWIWGKFRKMMAFLSIDLGFGWIWDDLGLLHLETKNRQR